MLGYLGQAALLAIGGHMVVEHQLSIGALVAFFLYLNRVLRTDSAARPAVQHLPAGQAAVVKLRTLFSVDPSTPEAAGATELPPIEGEIVFDHGHLRPTTPLLRSCAIIDLRIAAGETSRSWVRPGRVSRRWRS